MHDQIALYNSKKLIRAWAFFDWANSAYALVIMVAIFPAYFLAVTDDFIRLGSTSVSNSVIYAFSISFSYLVVAIMSPILSGIADQTHTKRLFLKTFTYIGSFSCISLLFFTGKGDVWFGLFASIIAAISFASSLVFYNAFLPEIVSEDQFDSVSAKGFAYGYFGSVILLVICLIIIQFHDFFLIEQGLATRISFLSVGLWWLGFAQISFRSLPSSQPLNLSSRIISSGWKEIKKIFIGLKNYKNIRFFLRSFFFYSMGVQTVIMLASSFAEKELDFETSEMILLILILQILAIVGAYIFAYVSKRKGNKLALLVMLGIWIGICLLAYFVDNSRQFYSIAMLVGLVMGGIQSISRSSYSKIIPETSSDTASYFSFYEVLEKMGIVIGSASFGLIEQLTGGMRNSILTLAIFFLIGAVLLLKVEFSEPES